MDSLKTKHVVSHEWERLFHLRQYRNGELSREEICDADFLLQAAGKYHGVPSERGCPVCGKVMQLTYWTYGEALGRRSGSARNAQELAEMSAEIQEKSAEFTVHEVEVCLNCRWNHLLKAATVY